MKRCKSTHYDSSHYDYCTFPVRHDEESKKKLSVMIFHNFLQINDTHGVEWQFKDIFVFIICSNVDIFLHHPISFHLINVSEKQEGKIRWPLQHEKLSISDYLVVGQCHKVLFF